MPSKRKRVRCDIFRGEYVDEEEGGEFDEEDDDELDEEEEYETNGAEEDDETDGAEEDDADSEGEDDDAVAEDGGDHLEIAQLVQIKGRIKLQGTDSPNGTRIASLKGTLIRRCNIRSFYDEMEGADNDTADVAFDVFDRYGRLKQDLKTHGNRMGSGIWQDEFDKGDILVLRNFHVEEAYRRQSLGRKFVRTMLEKVRQISKCFLTVVAPDQVITRPEGMTDEQFESIVARDFAITTSFTRSFGFRRLGSSGWFALSSDASHPCHNLAASDDFDLLPPPKERHLLEDQFYMDNVDMTADHKLITSLETAFKDVYCDDFRWERTDESGNTLPHIAALCSQPVAVAWLMRHAPCLLHRGNDEGETPPEAFQLSLEATRTQ